MKTDPLFPLKTDPVIDSKKPAGQCRILKAGEKKVITLEDWVTIKNLKKRNPKLGTRKIAQLMGLSKNTVKSALRSDNATRYERKVEVNSDIKPFENYIWQGLTQRHLRKSRILADIKSKAYKGPQSAFYRYCSKIAAT